SRLMQATTAAFLILLAVTFFYRSESYSRVVVFYTWGFTVVFATLLRAVLRRIQAALRRRGVGTARLVLAGLTPTTRLLVENIRRNPDLGYEILGVVSEEPLKKKTWENLRVLGALEKILEIVARERADEVILALPATAHHRLEAVLMNAGASKVVYKIVSDLFGIITNPLQTDDISGIPLFALKEAPLARPTARVLKRTLDLVCVVPALVLLSPLLLLLALAVKATSSGPALFRQERVGRDNRTFIILKFRTMRADAEKHTGPVWASKDDPRRTPIGTFLRRSSLDELPQLFNVLAGNMSLVGPRPERQHFVDQFQKTIPRYLERHRVKAGLTGWAQVNGLRGNTPVEERVKYDLWYVENWSLWLDLKILLRTALEVFHHTDAY
ncbi:MAG: undecaprenyl-phosphate glucose phosphotransferase, partial [Candidatus Firestonebacteria bacterium]|nr:undecaprenyl-phosphate glucose phosphotransferase [Candidatus Firestonebacteria bacterium]